MAHPRQVLRSAPLWLKALLLGQLVNAASSLAFFYLTLYLVAARHLSPGTAGLVTGGYGVGSIVGNVLGGSLGDRAARALAAGCDIALHCNGRMAEMVEIAGRTGPMTERAHRRFLDGRGFLSRHRDPVGTRGLAEAARRLAELLPEWG